MNQATEDPRLADTFRSIWATAETIPRGDDEQVQTAARFIEALIPNDLRPHLLVALMGVHMDLTGSQWSLLDEVDTATYEAEVRAIRVMAVEISRQGRIHHALTQLITEEICNHQDQAEETARG